MTAPGGAAAETEAGQAAGPRRRRPGLPGTTCPWTSCAAATPPGSATWRAATLRTQGRLAARQRAAARSGDRVTAGRRVPDLAGPVTDAGFAAGWRVVRGLPEPVARLAFRPGPTSPPAATAPERSGCGRTCTGSSPTPHRTSSTSWSAPACAATPATGARRSGCPRWTAPRCSPGWTRTDREAPSSRRCSRAAASSSRCRTAATGTSPGCGSSRPAPDGPPARFTTVAERLRPESLYRRFVAYRESLGFEVLAVGTARSVPDAHERCARAGSSAWSPTATSAPRASRSTSSASPRGCRPGRHGSPR